MPKLHFGFLGLGTMGKAMAANLLKQGGFELTVWNRTPEKCQELVALGASVAASPAACVGKCSIVITMLSDPRAVEEVYFGPQGIIEALQPGKACVDMSTVDAETSERIFDAVSKLGGRFLAAPVSGSKKPAEDGQLIIISGGDKSLFNEVLPAFEVMGKKSLYLGRVDKASDMKLVVNMIMGSMMAAFAEGLNLAEKSGLKGSDLLDVLDCGAMSNPMFRLKGPHMLRHDYPTAFPLQHQQKDLRLALQLAENNHQRLLVASASYQLFQMASQVGLGEADFSAVNEVLSKPTSSLGN